MSTHLFLTLSTKGYGETLLGVHVARSLRSRGDDVVFVTHGSSASLLASSAFAFESVADHAGALLPLYVAQMVEEHRPATIVLSDFFTTDLWFAHHDVDRSFLHGFGLPIAAIDTWDIKRSGTAIDIYWRKTRQFEDWTGELALLLRPAPIAAATGDANVYSFLPAECLADRATRAHVRAELGLPATARLALFCTAAWQQTQYACPHAQRFAAALPQLLAGYFDDLGNDVHLLHVGPRSYEFTGRPWYHYRDQLDPTDFARVVASADLLLTANISSTTIGKAMVSDVPVVAVINSFECETPAAGAALPFPVHQATQSWLAANAPIYRYSMWPVGYHAFLEPILSDNPYRDAITTAELLDRPGVVGTIDALVRPGNARTGALERQRAYVSAVRALPNPADLLTAHMCGVS